MKLLELIGELQKALVTQQSMIAKLTKHSSHTAKVVTLNATQALQNDNALLKRLKDTETVVNAMLKRERDEIIATIGKSDID